MQFHVDVGITHVAVAYIHTCVHTYLTLLLSVLAHVLLLGAGMASAATTTPDQSAHSTQVSAVVVGHLVAPGSVGVNCQGLFTA